MTGRERWGNVNNYAPFLSYLQSDVDRLLSEADMHVLSMLLIWRVAHFLQKAERDNRCDWRADGHHQQSGGPAQAQPGGQQHPGTHTHTRMANTLLGAESPQRGSQMAEWLGNRAINQKVASSIPGLAKCCCVLGQGTSPYLPRGECPCTYCKSLWIRASAK